MNEKTVRLNNKDIPCRDVLQIKLATVSDKIFYEIKYREFEPSYHETVVLLPRDKAVKIEKTVRKACSR